MKKPFFTILFALLLTGMLALAFDLRPVKEGIYPISALAQEPPPSPTRDETTSAMPSILIPLWTFGAAIIAAAGMIAWKYKAVLEFMVLCCSTQRAS